jgi:hypothetical protein
MDLLISKPNHAYVKSFIEFIYIHVNVLRSSNSSSNPPVVLVILLLLIIIIRGEQPVAAERAGSIAAEPLEDAVLVEGVGVGHGATYNWPFGSREANSLVSSRIELSCMGKIEADMASARIMDVMMLFHTLYSSLGVSLGGTWIFYRKELVWKKS